MAKPNVEDHENRIQRLEDAMARLAVTMEVLADREGRLDEALVSMADSVTAFRQDMALREAARDKEMAEFRAEMAALRKETDKRMQELWKETDKRISALVSAIGRMLPPAA